MGLDTYIFVAIRLSQIHDTTVLIDGERKAVEKREWAVLIIVLILLVLWFERREQPEDAGDLGCVSDMFSGYREGFVDVPASSLAVVHDECGSLKWAWLLALSPVSWNARALKSNVRGPVARRSATTADSGVSPDGQPYVG